MISNAIIWYGLMAVFFLGCVYFGSEGDGLA